MKSRFINRNKKKSVLALLLFLLRRKETVILLAVLLASFLFVSPSSLLLRLPGGARLAAAIAWLAEQGGADVSRWGLGLAGHPSFNELSSAFRAAKEGGRPVGWGPFFVPHGLGAGRGSLDFVKGKQSELGPAGPEVAGGTSENVSGIVDPDESRRDPNGGAVPLTPDELRGGLGDSRGAAGGQGAGSSAGLSGGVFASKGFFNGPSVVTSVSRAQNLAHAGFDHGLTPGTPGFRVARGATGHLASWRANGINAQVAKGIANAQALADTRTLTYLAEAKAVDKAVTTDCPTCSGEIQMNATGAIYDGHKTSGDVLNTANWPNDPGLPPSPDQAEQDAAKLQQCVDAMNTCQQNQIGPTKRLGELDDELTGWYSQIGKACSDPCNCGPCQDLKSKINGVCTGELPTVNAQLSQPCDLPSFCASLGMTPPTVVVGAGTSLCDNPNVGKCGCTSIICDISCLF